ncbi:beta-ketoacyl synthase chain length factor [Sulfurimonas sp.]|uniref:beta-ketoacyl synthase chain length factor n=1 Tax=Sulfurimonas sp. TaxID=2022749 RepID=UPI002AAFA83F|nr:beta-ketoacyl synthase chain length factor [Sulfurimonas sp.]
MKINIKILKKAWVSDKIKLENLNEKELVKKMILRRRLSRSSKILIKLASECEFKTGNMIYGSAYGEVFDTVNILNSIQNKEPVSPSAFQNSVYNTAASYHSILYGNKSEIITLSCGDETSYCAMQQAALTLFQEDKVFVSCVEAIGFNGVDELNKCDYDLECGVGFLIEKTDKEANIVINIKKQKGVPNSMLWMKNLYDLCGNKNECIVSIKL